MSSVALRAGWAGMASGVAQVGLEERGTAGRVVGQQFLGPGQDQRVIVHVHHPAARVDGLGHLVHVVHGREPGPDVQELPDPGLGYQVPDRPAQERPVLPGPGPGVRRRFQQPGDGRPVGFKVVLAAEQGRRFPEADRQSNRSG
jgi:hypothetical protein